MQDKSRQGKDFLERRRQLLKMGAAGMPMILTLKASANQTIHSALDCEFILTSAVNILVDHEGRVWVGESTIQQNGAGKLKTSDIQSFKDNADFVFPSGTAPDDFIPDACSSNSGSSNGNDCGWGNDLYDETGDNNDQDSCPADPPRETPWFEEDGQSGEPGNRGHSYGGNGNDRNHGGNGGWDDDDWDDDDGNGNGNGNPWTDCGYNYYQITANTTITPLNYMNQNGNWQISGAEGLYLVLGSKYLDYYGNDGGFPGISCLHSILMYLETV
ncbi:hypothetical protein [Kordiimonas gwangyangensis]|uniref:hypothetical protein n=1 Tax=Kordiimonas gwangyangensis TaxID=288022 RepID=UPI00039E7BBE|nr:hypothetical protein [Kordiimonas gwangyangensis]